MSEKIYLDQTPWHRVISEYAPEDFEQRLAVAGYEVCFGEDNLSEFAGLYHDADSPHNVAVGKRVFSFIFKLKELLYLESVHNLIAGDIVCLRTGGRVLPCASDSVVGQTRIEIARLALGYADEATEFTTARVQEIRNDMPRHRETIIHRNQQADYPADFSHWLQRQDWKRQVLERSQYANAIAAVSNARLFDYPERYPFLNTYVNAVLYENYLALTHREGPSPKRVPDARHLMSAQAADWLVTDDRKLVGAVDRLSPKVKAMSWSRLYSLLE